ncbi:unnamed protein product, partial [marine sediment metagenome]
EKILSSISLAARQNRVSIVTGDTKTVEAGAADKIFINTAGLGLKLAGVDLGFKRINVGDKIIINGTIGDHGMTIISQREDIKFQSQLKSDCAGLAELTCQLLEGSHSAKRHKTRSAEETSGVNPVRNKTPEVSASGLRGISNGVKFMRDPTRGGLAATLNEISRGTGLSIEISEADVPVNPTVQTAADMLGFDVLTIANEGKFVAIVSPESADRCLNICKNNRLGKKASIIGEVIETRDVPTVELITKIG